MTDKQKILQVCMRKNDVVAGIDLFEEVGRAFDRSDEFYFLLLSGDRDLELESRIKGQVINFGARKKSVSPSNPLLLLRLFFLLRRIAPDVVITHRYKPFAMCALLSRFFRGVRFISVFHGLDEFEKQKKRRAAMRVQRRWTFVAVSRAVQRDMVAAGIDPERITVIPNAIDIEQLLATQLPRDEARAALGLEADARVVGTIGRMVPIKAHALLVSAMAPVLAESEKARLVIIGDGPERQRVLDTAKQLSVSEQVLLQGALKNAYQYLPAFDVFVLPSLTEGMPIALLEAVATGLPVVATNVGGIAELVSDERFVVPPGDAERLSVAIRAVLAMTPQERTSYRENLYMALVANHSIDQYRNRYRRLVAANEGGSSSTDIRDNL